mgnify:FL=1
MRKKSLIIASFFLSVVAVHAQRPIKVERTKADLFPEWVEFGESEAPAFKSNQVWLIDPQGRSSISSSLRPITKEKDQIGFEHHRMQQMYNDIPVEHAVYIAHVKNG